MLVTQRTPYRTLLVALVVALAAPAGPRPPEDDWIDVFHGRLGKDALARDVNASGQLAGSFLARDGFHAFVTVGRRVLVTGDERGLTLEKTTVADLGRAKRVVLTHDTTTLIGGAGDKGAILARCAELRRTLEETTSDYEREKLEERLAKLSGGVAVIRAGAPSEAEAKRLKDAYEDAIASTKAAVAEGIVPGGGVALLRVLPAVLAAAEAARGDEATGVRVLARALEAPARQIAQNSGFDPGVIVERLKQATGTSGFDARSGRFVDLFEAGILDATKVVRMALENAVSVAGVLLLTEATMTEIEDERRGHREPAAESFE